MTKLFKGVRQAVRFTEFIARSLRFAWMHFLALALLAVAQQTTAFFAAPLGYYNLFYSVSNALLLFSFGVLAWLGFDIASKAGGNTFTAILAGIALAPVAQLIGFIASAFLAKTIVGVQAIALSLTVAALTGGVFAGAGAVVARVQSLHWIKK